MENESPLQRELDGQRTKEQPRTQTLHQTFLTFSLLCKLSEFHAKTRTPKCWQLRAKTHLLHEKGEKLDHRACSRV